MPLAGTVPRRIEELTADLARYDKRVTYSFDVFDSTYTSLFKGQFGRGPFHLLGQIPHHLADPAFQD